MEPQGWTALIVLAVATTLFVSKWLPVAVTALAIPVVLFATGSIDAAGALGGFGNKAALAIGAVFVIGGALKESGVATLMARGLLRVGGRSEALLVASLMAAAALLSAFMSNAAVVAMLLPVGAVLSRRSGVSASRLLMPLGFAAMLGGTITLIGTAPNLLVEDLLREQVGEHGDHFEVFDFASVGLLITVTGIACMALFGRRLLPTGTSGERRGGMLLPEDVAERHALPETLFMLTVSPASTCVDRTLSDADVRRRYGVEVLLIRRGSAVGERWMPPDSSVVLQTGDRLYVQGKEEAAWAFAEGDLLRFGLPGPQAVDKLLGRGITLAEVTLPPRSRLLGRTIRDVRFRWRYGLNVLLLLRREERVEEGMNDLPLEVGDTFLVSGPPDRVLRLKARPDFIVMSDLTDVEDVTRAPLAIGLLAAALVPPIFFGWPLALSAIGAALLMVITGCLSRPGLARAMDWNVLALIVGTIPLGQALGQHGVAGLAADAIQQSAAGGEFGVHAGLFLLSALIAVLTSNAAAAVIVGPVALMAAADPKAGLLAVAYGASCAFLLPFAQCNILVMAPGGYATRDFVRVGALTTVVMAVATFLGLLWFV